MIYGNVLRVVQLNPICIHMRIEFTTLIWAPEENNV